MCVWGCVCGGVYVRCVRVWEVYVVCVCVWVYVRGVGVCGVCEMWGCVEGVCEVCGGVGVWGV